MLLFFMMRAGGGTRLGVAVRIEARYNLTRSCLEAFVDDLPGLLVVQTRSPMVIRDLELLRELGNRVWVSMTLETNLDDVRKLFTPTSPTVEGRLRAMEKLHLAGIQVQAAVSPMLPNKASDFALRLSSVCSRVLVDTLFEGDGANGRRSQALGMEERFQRLGYEGWYNKNAHEPLLACLVEQIGSNRVAFSQEGFNSL